GPGGRPSRTPAPRRFDSALSGRARPSGEEPGTDSPSVSRGPSRFATDIRITSAPPASATSAICAEPHPRTRAAAWSIIRSVPGERFRTVIASRTTRLVERALVDRLPYPVPEGDGHVEVPLLHEARVVVRGVVPAERAHQGEAA